MAINTKTGKNYGGNIIKIDQYDLCRDRRKNNDYFVQKNTVNISEIGTIDYFTVESFGYKQYISQYVHIKGTDTFAYVKCRNGISKSSVGFNETNLITLQGTTNAAQAIENILSTLEDICENPTNEAPNGVVQIAYIRSATDIIPAIIKNLSPDKRLEIIERFHELALDGNHDPFTAPIKNRKGKYETRDRGIDYTAKLFLEMLGTLLAYEIIYATTEKEIHGLEDYFCNDAIMIDQAYGSIDGHRDPSVATSDSVYCSITAILRRRSEKEYNFFKTPRDTWSPKGENRKGTAANLSAFMARRAVKNGFADAKDYKIIEEYKTFTAFLHRTTEVFSDTYTVRYTEKNAIIVPINAEKCPTKEAKEGLERLAETTDNNALKYACLTQLEIISGLKKAAYYTREKRKIDSVKFLPFKSRDIDPFIIWRQNTITTLLIITIELLCILTTAILSYKLFINTELMNTIALTIHKTLIGITIVVILIPIAALLSGIRNAPDYPPYYGYYWWWY